MRLWSRPALSTALLCAVIAVGCSTASARDEECIQAGGICFASENASACGVPIQAACSTGYNCCADITLVDSGHGDAARDATAVEARAEASATDANRDALADAGVDGPGDAPPDAAFDAAPDGTEDAAADVAPDAVGDAADAPSEAPSDAQQDSPTSG